MCFFEGSRKRFSFDDLYILSLNHPRVKGKARCGGNTVRPE